MSTAPVSATSASLAGLSTGPDVAPPPLVPNFPAADPAPALTQPPQRWQLCTPDHENAARLAAASSLPLVIAELLIARGIHSQQAAQAFLNPEVAHLSDPFLMLGVAAAVERIELALTRCETILLYGDYDVDGTAAVVLLKTAIEMLAVQGETGRGCKVRFHVPHRIREGYGIQSSVLESAASEGVRLVISVDTGMRAFAEARRAKELGLDLIVTDHHLPDAGDELPIAVAVLNPNQPGCPYPEKFLCGAAIAFKLSQALLQRRDLRSLDQPSASARTRDKIIPSFLKMVALATVADAVPLREENRVLAALGIRELHRPAGVGLRALFRAAAIDPATKALTSFDLGFRLGPRINAAGRMDIAAEVVELFTTRDAARAHELAAKLERLNTERRETEALALRQVEDRLASDPNFAEKRIVVMAGDAWHRGIIGILASRIVERTAKPAIVVSIEDGVAYGSGRSIDGFPLLEAIETCADLYTRFGGHAFAVGFALPAGNLPEMERRLLRFAAEKLAGKPAERVLHIHAELPPERVTPALATWLHKLEPLGHGNAEPVFLARNLRLTASVRVMKEKHIRLEVVSNLSPELTAERASNASLAGSLHPAPIQLIGWNMAARARELELDRGSLIDLAYRVRENDHPQYGGLQLEIAGLQPASKEL